MKIYFLNISNHPSSQWGEEQKKVAMEFHKNSIPAGNIDYQDFCRSNAEIVDIPFPAVKIEDDEETLITRVFLKIFTLRKDGGYISAAMVQGEYTFTFSLVYLLLLAKISVVSAFSKRLVEERDGKKIVSFIFEGFRRYSKPSTEVFTDHPLGWPTVQFGEVTLHSAAIPEEGDGFRIQ